MSHLQTNNVKQCCILSVTIGMHDHILKLFSLLPYGNIAVNASPYFESKQVTIRHIIRLRYVILVIIIADKSHNPVTPCTTYFNPIT
jgi:uncharacterized membrane protein YccF (DUF307 family)